MQTFALLKDAYLELNHRKLFWVTLALSGLGVLSFAMIGNDQEGLTILHWSIPIPFFSTDFIPRADFYKFVFATLGVGYWLSWIATILALISTAGIFPEFVGSGSIDLMLSKPIGRTRLFLTKFMVGLLFVALQVTVFTSASIVIIGIRGGAWEPWLLLAIPLVVVFYSYLFCVQAVVGMISRSAIASIIAVMIFWMACFGLQAADGIVMMGRVMSEVSAEKLEKQLEGQTTMLERADESKRPARVVKVEKLQAEFDEAQHELSIWQTVGWWVHAANTVLPKTGETTDLLIRTLEDKAGLVSPGPPSDEENAYMFGMEVNRAEYIEALESEYDKSHSPMWILGTSLLFEAGVLAFGALWFSRRDF